jgi:DNA polymerase III epsilon subunit-like protein
MVSVGFGAGVGEVALICLADYLTGETLVNAFVNPKQIVSDWRTRYSGITAAAMKAAIDNGEALDGWEGAREAVWKHIDAETILVGHALQHDLEVLRMIHTRIVDSGILARNAVSPPSGRQWGLKGLCAQLLHLDVQNHGKKGHDCLEDVLATRELVLWCTREAARFNAWGAAVGKEEQRLKMAQAAQRAQKLAEQANAVNPPAKGQQSEGFEKQAAGLSSSDVESWL